MTRTILTAVLALTLTGCAPIREQLIRNNYLSTGRAPEGWVPKTSLCPAFVRNGWQDHPPGPLCWAPVPIVGHDDVADRAIYWRVCSARFPGDDKKIVACMKAPPPPPEVPAPKGGVH